MRSTLPAIIWLLFALSCTAQPAIPVHTLALDANHRLVLLDSTQAATTLLQDPVDHFFERVTASEMSIQMKVPLAEGQTRESMLPAFQQFLRRDVDTFSPEESAMVAEVMREVFLTCKDMDERIFPDSLLLIKTKANHYGRSVYYTRANTIVIPYDVLNPAMREAFRSTMYHELFHVYSRLHPEKRAQLYRLIGFEHIGLDQLILPDALAARVLFNPDGVDFGQKITLKTEDGKTINAIPVIYANNPGYKSGKRAFFGYVEFGLFQIEPTDSGRWKVITADDGFSSTLDLQKLPDFFRQIKDNTGYIIHPDEVLADNFSFLMLSQKDPSVTARFSPEGKKLIADIEAVIRK